MVTSRVVFAIRSAVAGPRAFATGARAAFPIGGNVHDNDPAVIDHHKAKTLKGENKSSIPSTAPGWSEALASDSEAATKADQSENITPEALQRQTVDHIKDVHQETPILEKVKETVTTTKEKVTKLAS